MSGGVDSSVAAWLLCERGHDVTGVFMRHGQASDVSAGATGGDCPDFCAAKMGLSPSQSRTKNVCCSAADAADARRIADRLKIPFYVLNFEDPFERIIDHFVHQYLAGRTPNPCILCNTWLKFGKLLEYADGIDARFVATGHYARLVWLEATQPGATQPGATGVSPVLQESHGQNARGTPVLQESHGQDARGTPALCRGVDKTKDQAYVLFGIDRRVLPRVMFPLGQRRKEEIRRIAAELGFDVAQKRDSQEICFVPDGDHARFIRRRRPDLKTDGQLVTTDGTVVGQHDGFERFTVGQRKGLGVAMGEPYYVVRIEPLTRRVVLGSHEELARRQLTADEANWLIEPPTEPFRAAVKIRYRSRAVDATVTPLPDSRFHVAFDEPRHGVAPGQAAVCFSGDRVLGGGWIE